MSLLLSAIVALAWLALVPLPLWWVLLICLLLAVLIFLYC